MRRVFLILIVVLVVGAVTGGVLWYLHRNTAEKLLQRSELALRAKQYDRALELAESAAAKEPANWQVYFKQDQALCGKCQYSEARKCLEEAAKHDPPGVTIQLTMADTYAMAARRSLASEETLRQTPVIRDAIAGLRQTNDHLSRISTKDNVGALDVQQAIGLNLTQTGAAQEALRDRLEKEAQLDATAGDAAGKATKQKAAQKAGREADRLFKQATDALLAVVKQDPKRAAAARTLIDLCVQRNDQKTLEVARQAIMSLEDPPPAVVVDLIRSEFRSVGEVAEDAKHLESAARQLDRILEKHPDDGDAKLARAEVAVRAGDLERAMKLCTQILGSAQDSGQKFGARFLRTRILVSQNKWSDAERELHSLKTEVPRWATVQYFYGKVAHETGKEEQAREAMRTVTDIERQFPKPDPVYAEAHRYLAESLLGGGFALGALTEAKAYYEAVRSDPSEAAVQSLPLALRLYVQAANETKQVGLARTALDTALKDHASRPDVLLAVYEGYRQLGEKPEFARKMLEKAAECTPATNDVLGRLAVARATALLGRISEAEKMLTEEAKRSPKDPRAPFELGRFFALTGRPLQAIEQFRKTVSLDDHNLPCRESLATILYESGLHDDCLTECQAILNRSVTNAKAVRLVNLIRLARGQDLLPQSGPGTPTGRSLARALLANGRPQQCIEVCETLLMETPNDIETRLILGQAYQTLGRNKDCKDEWAKVLKQIPDQLPIYLQLAGIMNATKKPEENRTLTPKEVETELAAIDGANQDLVIIAMGWLFDRLGRYDEAAETYGRLAGRQGALEDIRNLARLFRARSLANAGHIDQATTELDQVAATSMGRAQALYDKASLLTSANRSKEADAILAEMVRQAVKDKDTATLERVTALYSRLKRTDKALAVCEQMDKVLPNDAGPCLMRASILAAAGRLNETITCYQQAIERQPGNLRSYTALARAFEAAAKPLEALATLKQLEGLGPTGQLEALFQQGSMFARWGLQSQAVESFEQAAKLVREADPQLQLALGQAFAGLGRKDRARAILGTIPEYAPQYVIARQILANLESTDDARLAVLRQARKVKPDAPALLVQEMNVLLRANRPDDVIKAFREFSARQPPASVMPNEALNPALQAMLVTGDLAGAANLTAQAARNSGNPQWRQAAALLAIAQKSESAKALLPQIGAAGPYETMLGLLVASQTGQPVAPWKKRWDQLLQILPQLTPPQTLSPAYRT
ncbi:MAG: tetratricopeptide repeat protein, partial [Planctomycetota bacterium]|nr:tetratricopeptide repeat protein [Planctomycetota bacterium]